MWTETNTTEQLIKGIVKYGPDILEHCVCTDDLSKYKNKIEKEFLDYPLPKKSIDSTNWFLPYKYQNTDMKQHLLARCSSDAELDRVNIELAEYEKRNLFPLLKQMVYIIDTLREKNIIWGVGRGSRDASFVLYLRGVHKVDRIKYNIPLNEFFKGEI